MCRAVNSSVCEEGVSRYFVDVVTDVREWVRLAQESGVGGVPPQRSVAGGSVSREVHPYLRGEEPPEGTVGFHLAARYSRWASMPWYVWLTPDAAAHGNVRW